VKPANLIGFLANASLGGLRKSEEPIQDIASTKQGRGFLLGLD
jgi:hypothetical protein